MSKGEVMKIMETFGSQMVLHQWPKDIQTRAKSAWLPIQAEQSSPW